jgi:hypothetical protein
MRDCDGRSRECALVDACLQDREGPVKALVLIGEGMR